MRKKTALATQQKNLTKEYYDKTSKVTDIEDEACISAKAMELLKADNDYASKTVQESNVNKSTGVQARALNAYKCFAS